jgi:transposase InsO family protein
VTADVHLLAAETKTSVSAVCRALELPRSSAYARRNRKPSRRAQDTAQLDVEVAAVHDGSKHRYGSPRVHRALRRQGRRVSRKRVEARMRALGLRAKRAKRFRRTTQADGAHTPSPNLLDRQFTKATPHEAWCGDISIIQTQQGWVYLALLIDLCTRSIVGWSVSRRCDTALALKLLEQGRCASPATTRAVASYRSRLDLHSGCVPRSVARTRYGSKHEPSRQLLGQQSVAESTIGTIKAELFDGVPVDIHDVRHQLFEYIESFYNRHRLHSSLGYITPNEKLQLVAAEQAA